MLQLKKIIFTLFSLLFIQMLSAQITTMDAKMAQPQNSEGIFYSLPLTVFKIDVDLEVTEKIPGPLKSYSRKFLGVSDFIDRESTEYNIVDVKVTPLTLEDKNNMYFVSFNQERGKEKEQKKQFIELTSKGLLRSFNIKPDVDNNKSVISNENTRIYILGEEAERFNYNADYNRREEIDTIIRKITVDTLTINKFLYRTNWVDKTPEERADDAAKEIKRIRENRMNLLTGYHEVNFSGSIEYMDRELKKLEKQYLELFLGKELKTIRHFTVFFTPDDNELQKEIFKSDAGDHLLIKVKKLGEPANKNVNTPLDNALIYRIPVSCEVKAVYNRVNMFNDIFYVNQLGSKSSVAVNRMAVEFDPATGLPKKISRY